MEIGLTVDGVPRQVDVEPRTTLADALRDQCAATSVHLGCEQGACGACTVHLDGVAVRACLLLAVQADGHRVTTVAGLPAGTGLHPVQRAFADHGAFQCGFCTPGFVLLLAAELAEPDLDDAALLDLVSSNLCRCTGYQGILAAARAARAAAQLAG
ncbi:MAG TPA: (2Fe-2S)-binding protein [Mycobacteriales bacterium]|nr:(2Fe-2S)-binding protein [Mycobacteriales bacterium]